MQPVKNFLILQTEVYTPQAERPTRPAKRAASYNRHVTGPGGGTSMLFRRPKCGGNAPDALRVVGGREAASAVRLIRAAGVTNLRL